MDRRPPRVASARALLWAVFMMPGRVDRIEQLPRYRTAETTPASAPLPSATRRRRTPAVPTPSAPSERNHDLARHEHSLTQLWAAAYLLAPDPTRAPPLSAPRTRAARCDDRTTDERYTRPWLLADAAHRPPRAAQDVLGGDSRRSPAQSEPAFTAPAAPLYRASQRARRATVEADIRRPRPRPLPPSRGVDQAEIRRAPAADRRRDRRDPAGPPRGPP
eukprot:scaffold3964_cov336-Prasinococcus_capsulatus_cf.AAC.11